MIGRSRVIAAVISIAWLAALAGTAPASIAGTRQPTSGSQLWVSRYNGPGNSLDQASSVQVSPDGSKVFVTGWSWGITGGLDYDTLAYDAITGAQLWESRYNGPNNSTDQATS